MTVTHLKKNSKRSQGSRSSKNTSKAQCVFNTSAVSLLLDKAQFLHANLRVWKTTFSFIQNNNECIEIYKITFQQKNEPRIARNDGTNLIP